MRGVLPAFFGNVDLFNDIRLVTLFIFVSREIISIYNTQINKIL